MTARPRPGAASQLEPQLSNTLLLGTLGVAEQEPVALRVCQLAASEALCAERDEALGFRFGVVGDELEAQRRLRRRRLLAALEEEPRTAALRVDRIRVRLELGRVDAGIEELLRQVLGEFGLAVAERLAPERAQPHRLGGRERHVAEIRVVAARVRALEAEPVSLRIAEHGPRLLDRADLDPLTHDEPGAEAE